MKEVGDSRVWWTILLLIAVCVLLSGCLEFKSIEQPSSILAGETFTVFIEVTAAPAGEGRPYCGVRLPIGWTIPDDAILCTGAYTQTIHYDNDLSLEQESLSPSPEGYYWWVGTGDEKDSEGKSVYAEVQIQTNHQTGRFSIDYMLAFTLPDSPPNLSNQQRSDNHLIEVVDEYTARELQALVQGDMVSLSWGVPFVSEGLTGYNVYRDGQIINTDLVLDTVYIDESPVQELVCYAISSVYDNDDVHLMPYEIKVLVFSGGAGEPNDPYRIAAAEQLASFSSADFPHLLDKYFVLVDDIDLDPNLSGSQVFDRAVIAPDVSDLEDGFQGTAFTGMFDGNGHTISNLTIDGGRNLGLFGRLEHGAEVKNLGVVDIRINGYGIHIGGLVGDNNGAIRACYARGSACGGGYVGGLVGYNRGDVTICYSTSEVGGEYDVGGLVGINEGDVAYCYSTGSVSGETYVGGLVGENGGEVKYSFWDVETSDQSQSEGGVGLTTAEMMDPNFIGLNGWAGDPNWILDSGHDYPHLTWEGTPGEFIPELIIDWMEGIGTADHPYEIVNDDQLVKIGKAFILWDKHFVLSTDINLIHKSWSMSVIPEFWGTFEGNGFAVRNLTIVGGNELGLFGQVKEGAQIMNLGVHANIVGTGSNIGILAGQNNGNVTNCYSIGSISGEDCIGGLVGFNHNRNGIISDCYSSVIVSGSRDVGGLVGKNYSDVNDCYSTAEVRGDWCVGGLVGNNALEGNITNCYSSATVRGSRYVGGLVGSNDNFRNGGNISQCYNTGSVSGSNRCIGGLVGVNWSNVSYSYNTGSVSGGTTIGGLIGENLGDVNNCYSIGPVSGVSRVGNVLGSIGGLVGCNQRVIVNCYSAGSVSGDEYVGGLVGENLDSTENSFWDIETSNRTEMCGFQIRGTGTTGCDDNYGKTTAEMQTASTFLEANWDFVDETANGTEDIWWILEGQDYPRLWWELIHEN